MKFIFRIFQNSEPAAPDDWPESGDKSALIVSTYVLRSNLNICAIITVNMLKDIFVNNFFFEISEPQNYHSKSHCNKVPTKLGIIGFSAVTFEWIIYIP